jgi:hypothetical protein
MGINRVGSIGPNPPYAELVMGINRRYPRDKCKEVGWVPQVPTRWVCQALNGVRSFSSLM